jgi:hypothetical protein
MVRGKDVILSSALFANRARSAQDGGTTSGLGRRPSASASALGDRRHHRHRHERQAAPARAALPAGAPGRPGDEELFFTGNAQQIEELFRDLTFISRDYRERKPLDTPDERRHPQRHDPAGQ